MSLKLHYTCHAHCTNYHVAQFIYAIKVFPLTSFGIKWCFLLWLVYCITQVIVPKPRVQFRKRISDSNLCLHENLASYIRHCDKNWHFLYNFKAIYVIDCFNNVANLPNYQVTQISITYEQIFKFIRLKPYFKRDFFSRKWVFLFVLLHYF